MDLELKITIKRKSNFVNTIDSCFCDGFKINFLEYLYKFIGIRTVLKTVGCKPERAAIKPRFIVRSVVTIVHDMSNN